MGYNEPTSSLALRLACDENVGGARQAGSTCVRVVPTFSGQSSGPVTP
eukprot:CAMPEP_0174848110 /NCGR_PEP_ID=MMETSP1114-20130205/13326_1 /TAXON_ID=312471 /ORGANISM="Neobodo designis, Strain CCAP 1951/1" /LENGTH=47 /DNA_ID= /DNA_START= /DNA_END= /DNA_ORIENTATION=